MSSNKKNININVPRRYLPPSLSLKDKKKQSKMLIKSKKLYKKKQYYTRKKVKSFHSKTSNHILNARKTYNIDSIVPSKELSRATGCSLDSLQKIVNKGEGAYFSSGSRPNQTAQSWGIARLASAITAGKAAAVDYNILEEGCDHKKKAFKLAKKARKIYHYGHSSTAKVHMHI
jgi:hypothetical protein